MILEIHGGGFGNKGAQLMLMAVAERFARVPGVQMYMSPALNQPKAAQRELGLISHFPWPAARGGRLFPIRLAANLAVSSLVPRGVCRVLGVARYQDSDGLLDISGIRFGDAVQPVAGANFVRLARQYRKRGRPVILLPQMLGPFRRRESAELFRQIHEEATLIFARDPHSYGYAREVVGESPKVQQAPDLTVFYDGGLAPRSSETPYACVVPNARMLDRGDAAWRRIYVDRLAQAVEAIDGVEIRPKILVHSVAGEEDQPLADAVRARVGAERCDIVVADDPLEAKALIGGARLIVASRYHSVVSALSSGVPAIVMGWAHKYDALLEEFAISALRHDVTDGPEHLTSTIVSLADPTERRRVHAQLKEAKASMLTAHETMWSFVSRALALSSEALIVPRAA